MRRFLFRLGLVPLILSLVHCGGGSSDSGGGSSGATPYDGPWFMVATLNALVGGTRTILTDTTHVQVRGSGIVTITDTDSECPTNIVLNGDVLSYEASCSFAATSENGSAPCVLTWRFRTQIHGPPGAGEASANFGPVTDACGGVATTHSGILVASQGSGPEPEPDTGSNTDTNTDTGTNTDTADDG